MDVRTSPLKHGYEEETCGYLEKSRDEKESAESMVEFVRSYAIVESFMKSNVDPRV
jgi:hypothetical protein